MARLGAYGRAFWRWFITPPPVQSLWKRAAWALWITPPIMLFPLLLPILQPSTVPDVLAEYWSGYLLWFGLPWALGALCWWRGQRVSD